MTQPPSGHGAATTTPIPGIVITVSDRCTAGIRTDRSGPKAVKILAEHGITCPDPVIVPDGIESVQAAVRTAIANGARFVLTTGGTGVAPRDLSPEALAGMIATRLPGIETAILMRGLAHTELAPLSRCLVGVTARNASGVLVVAAPGSTGGVADAASVVGPLAKHVLEQLKGYDH